MTDQELRALVRDAIARHLGSNPDGRTAFADGGAMPANFLREHASHAMFALPDSAGGGPEGSGDSEACVIEPAVRCNHCGYCKSMGH